MPQTADQVLREVMEALGDARLLIDLGMPGQARGVIHDSQHQIRCFLNGEEPRVGQIRIDADTAP